MYLEPYRKEIHSNIKDVIKKRNYSLSSDEEKMVLICNIVINRFYCLVEEIFPTIRKEAKALTCTITYSLTFNNRWILTKIFKDIFNVSIISGHTGEKSPNWLTPDGFPYPNDDTFCESESVQMRCLWKPDNPFVFSEKPIQVLLNQNVLQKPRDFHLEKFHEELYEAALAGEDTDVVFKVEEKVFRAHQVILKRKSCRDYFEPHLKRWRGDRNENNEIVLKDVSAETFDSIHRFIYTGTVKETPTLRDIIHLLEQADMYRLVGLMNLATHRLEMHFYNNPLTVDTLEDALYIVEHFKNVYAANVCIFFAEQSDQNMESLVKHVSKQTYEILMKEARAKDSKKLVEALVTKSFELVKQ